MDNKASRWIAVRFIAIFLMSALLGIVGIIKLPQDRYIRYQFADASNGIQSKWIYERIHFDPTPIDIAFIGTSRTRSNIHSRLLEKELAARGYKVKAANLHMVGTGRDMQYAVAKELLTHKKVKVLAIELTGLEDRLPHVNFVRIADTHDILAAPLFINTRYLSDLIQLPGRQLDLFLKTEEEKLGLADYGFHPERYRGPNLDFAEKGILDDGTVLWNTGTHSRAEIERARRAKEAHMHPPVLPQALNSIEFRLPRLYIRKIANLAQSHGAKVVFVYLSRYKGPHEPAVLKRYEGKYPVINPAALVADDYRNYQDASHVNWHAAQIVTRKVAEALADLNMFDKAPADPGSTHLQANRRSAAEAPAAVHAPAG